MRSSGERFPRCWWIQYDMKPPTMRSCHQSVARISSTQSIDVFQSSWMSWSSKIIAVGTVDSSQRMAGSDHESTYRRQYSW